MNAYRKLFHVSLISIIGIFELSADSNEQLILPEDLLPQLNQILDAASQNAPELIEQRFLRQEADQRLLQAKSDYYPSLDLGASFGGKQQYRNDAEDTNNFGLTYNAQLSRPLYHWGAIEARIEQARINNNTNTLNYLENTRLIFRRIRSDYLTLLLNEISLKNENIRKENLESELERVKIDFEAGKISELTFKSTQLDLQNSLLLIKRIERDQKRIITRFQQSAGWYTPVDAEQTIPAFDLSALQAWLDQESNKQTAAWTSLHYDTRLLDNEIKDQEEAMTIITARQRPLLNFTARASQDQSNTSTANNVDTLTLFAGLSVSWNIFDGFQTKHRKIEANLKRRRLISKLDRLKNDLLQEQQSMLDALYFQLENTQILEDRHALEAKLFENKATDFEAGRLTQNDLRESELNLTALELELMTARADLLMSLSDYSDLTAPMLTENQ